MFNYIHCSGWIEDRDLEDEDWVKDRGLRQKFKKEERWQITMIIVQIN